MPGLYYILNEDHTVTGVGMQTWSEWYNNPLSSRRVALDHVGSWMISTVFLGIDYSFRGDGPPILFETMVFEHGDVGAESEVNRYSTWDDAIQGHQAMVERYKTETSEPSTSLIVEYQVPVDYTKRLIRRKEGIDEVTTSTICSVQRRIRRDS